MHIEHDKVGRFYSNINLALKKQLPSPEEGESLEAYVVRADEFYKNQMLKSLGREQRIRQVTEEKKALEKANRTMEERIRKSYEAQICGIIKEIGSVQNARHAIHYRKSKHHFIYTPNVHSNIEIYFRIRYAYNETSAKKGK